MDKLIKKTALLCMALFVFMLIACNADNSRLPEKMPSDFNFVLNYGVNAKNQLDTLKGTYTKDMVTETSVTTALKFSDEKMNEIYSSMRKINILNYPDNFSPKSNMRQTPFKTYSIKIIVNGKEKNIYWEDENASNSKDAVQLRDLLNAIHKIVSGKEEYKKLPKPKAGYL